MVLVRELTPCGLAAETLGRVEAMLLSRSQSSRRRMASAAGGTSGQSRPAELYAWALHQLMEQAARTDAAWKRPHCSTAS